MTEAAFTPRHVGLIPDGTRRWAKSHKVSQAVAYDRALDRVVELVEHLWARGVQTVSIYFLSYKNLSRTSEELVPVYAAETRVCQTSLAAAAQTWDAQVRAVGETQLVPEAFSMALAKLEERQSHSGRRLYLLVAYDPRRELASCADLLRCHERDPLHALTVSQPVDLVIRTSGVHSLSDFLPLQASYAQLYFVEEHINDVTVAQLDEMLDRYAGTPRRFGR